MSWLLVSQYGAWTALILLINLPRGIECNLARAFLLLSSPSSSSSSVLVEATEPRIALSGWGRASSRRAISASKSLRGVLKTVLGGTPTSGLSSCSYEQQKKIKVTPNETEFKMPGLTQSQLPKEMSTATSAMSRIAGLAYCNT